MTQDFEREKYRFLTDEQFARMRQVETHQAVSLDELQVGDRLGIGARDGRFREREIGSFILDVLAIEQAEVEGRRKLIFAYSPGMMGFAFHGEHGEKLELPPGATLESGFSSISYIYHPGRQPIAPDYSRIKTGEKYWFNNAGGSGKIAIAQDIRNIALLRKG